MGFLRTTNRRTHGIEGDAVAVSQLLRRKKVGTRLGKGVHHCLVKGVTHRNVDGTSRSEAMKGCSIGDSVKLLPEPQNEHDRNAIRVLRIDGRQIGYISARQAKRFAGRVHLLTATVDSWASDDWGNDTLKLLVIDPTEQEPCESGLPAAKDQTWSTDPTGISVPPKPETAAPSVRKRDVLGCVLMGVLAASLLYEHWWLLGAAATGGVAYSVYLLRG